MLELVSITDQKAMTTSLIIAEAFEKQHKDVLRSISNVECSDEFRRRNFAPSSYMNSQNKMMPLFNITRDGFTFLAMGFTGKAAAEFKEKFIAAFNVMEQELLEGQGERKQIDINYHRQTESPNGADIRYTLSLDKFLCNTSPKRLAILSRLTGIDFEDLADLPDSEELTADQAVRQVEIKNFVGECCAVEPGARVGATDLYTAYVTWHAVRLPDEDPVTQKIFGGFMRIMGFVKKKSNKHFYRDLKLKTQGDE